MYSTESSSISLLSVPQLTLGCIQLLYINDTFLMFFLDTTDFQPGFGIVVFQPNDREACGQVQIKDDDTPEGPEVFMVTFTPSNLVIPRPDLSSPVAEVTIIDDDSMFMTLTLQSSYKFRIWSTQPSSKQVVVLTEGFKFGVKLQLI